MLFTTFALAGRLTPGFANDARGIVLRESWAGVADDGGCGTCRQTPQLREVAALVEQAEEKAGTPRIASPSRIYWGSRLPDWGDSSHLTHPDDNRAPRAIRHANQSRAMWDRGTAQPPRPGCSPD